MKLTNLTIKDFITPEAELTFLVGAGCSVNPPSCLPLGRTMIEALINYTCADSEINKILGKEELEDGSKLDGLRFEQLIEIVRDRLDPKLKIIDFYGLCDKPNIQHFFLADMIKKGQFVITTNFDFLIEYALLYSGVPKKKILPIITKNDFQKYDDPKKLYKKGKKALYKIHGSTKNVFTEENTRDSLIATIQALSSNKEGLNIFQLEHFKKSAFKNLTKNRSLVIIGYSGSDDFDVIPTLKVLEDIQDVIWINHTPDDGGKELFYEIEAEDIKNYENLTRLNKILVAIKRMDYANHIFRVDVDTLRIVKKLITPQIKISSDMFSIDPYEWLSQNIKTPDKFMKLYIPDKIYNDFSKYKDAMSVTKDILNIAEKEDNQLWKATSLNNMGMIYLAQGEYREALKRFKGALQIDDQLGNLSGKSTVYNNIALIYLSRKIDYGKALKYFEEVLQIDEQLGNLRGKASSFNNIGAVYKAQENYFGALKLFKAALKIFNKLGDLRSEATTFNNIGSLYGSQEMYSEALKWYKETLRIDEQLGDLNGKATVYNNIGLIYNKIGLIYNDQEKYIEAIKHYKKSLKILEQLGDSDRKSRCLRNIGRTHDNQGNYFKALKRYESALQITRQFGYLATEESLLNDIAFNYFDRGFYPEALIRYNEALQIDEKLGNLSKKVTCLNNIGSTFDKLKDYNKALEYFKRGLEVTEQLEEPSANVERANSLSWIGKMQARMHNIEDALIYFNEALEIYEELGFEREIQTIQRFISTI